MKAALYIRVSTTHQIDKDSLPFQKKELINYSKYALGIDDYEIFEDAGYSGKNTDRPKYQEMITRCKAKEFTHLLVWKIDRISRNLKDFTDMYDELKDCGVSFISKNEQFDTSSAMGEAMLKIILVFAELERKLTGERVTSIMLSRAEKGLWNGATVPLGYKWSPEEKFPIIDEDESKVVQYVYDLYEKLGSTPKVAFKLNEEGIKTKRDGKWTGKTVGDVLKNPFYIGTYRYNVKTSKTRRWKDEKEWIVKPGNHPGIIDGAQFNRVNEIIKANYRGYGDFQRSNTNTHIFSKMLTCKNCGEGLNAGCDRKRKDGYIPSRYTCPSFKHSNEVNCQNFISDIVLLPFVLNYINNFVNLSNSIKKGHSIHDIERILLSGRFFKDVAGIDTESLELMRSLFVEGFDYTKGGKGKLNDPETNLELENLKKEKMKYEKGLQRLEDLYLFSEESMSKKDFLFKKRDITDKIEDINNKIYNLNRRMTDYSMTHNLVFLSRSSQFLIAEQLTDGEIDYRDFVKSLSKEVVRDFIKLSVRKIEVYDKRITAITFNNGITNKFVYVDKPKDVPKQKYIYRRYEPMVLEYLEKHGSITRVQAEELTGMKRTGVLSILKELVERGVVVKVGSSVATKYKKISR